MSPEDLHALKARQHCTWNQLARVCGVTRLTMYRWQTGQFAVSTEAAARLALIERLWQGTRCPTCHGTGIRPDAPAAHTAPPHPSGP